MTTKTTDYRWRRILAASSFLLLAGLLAGCNTMEGLGRDTQAAGEAIEDQAEGANQ